jgi:hypothetical protein
VSDIEQRMWTWLESTDATEPGASFILSPRSARELLGKIGSARGHADDEAEEPLTDDPLTEGDLAADREPWSATKHRLAESVARTMLSDPNFRHWVEVEMAGMVKKQTSGERLLEHAQTMFEIGQEPGRVWFWINGLKTYGDGETWTEAYHDTLDEIGYALTALWDAYEAGRAGEAG